MHLINNQSQSTTPIQQHSGITVTRLKYSQATWFHHFWPKHSVVMHLLSANHSTLKPCSYVCQCLGSISFPFIFYLCSVILSYRVLNMGVGHLNSLTFWMFYIICFIMFFVTPLLLHEHLRHFHNFVMALQQTSLLFSFFFFFFFFLH